MEITGAEELNKWFKQADHDLQMAKSIIEDGGYDTCAFLCQQAVEKYLKALYIHKNQKNPPKTHHLDELAKVLSCPEDILDIARELSSDYMISRYPDAATLAPYEEYTGSDAQSKIAKAEKAIKWVKSQLKL
jgi:HEPN domain-containing protein